MAEKMTLEENTVFAELVLAPILKIIDEAVINYDIDRLRATYKEMQSRLGTMEAFPFQETMDKADSTRAINRIYNEILNLIECRIEQRNVAIEQASTPRGDDLLRKLGF